MSARCVENGATEMSDSFYTGAPPKPLVEDVNRVRRATPPSPGVRRLREVENETAKLAEQIDREHKRRKRRKREGAAEGVDDARATEALARAEAILSAADAKVRKVWTFNQITGEVTGEQPLGAIRENALRMLGIEFGADAPVYVVCANCGETFAVKAGTAANQVPTVCKRGCKCACGKRVSVDAARRAAKECRRARCAVCRNAALSAVTPEQHSARAKAALAKLTPEQRSARAKAMGAAMTPEQRSARAKAALAKLTPEKRAASTKAASAALRAKAAAKTRCARGHKFAATGRSHDGACIACRREYDRARYAANKDLLNERQRARYAAAKQAKTGGES